MNEQNIINEINRLGEKDEDSSYLYLKCHTCKELLQNSRENQAHYACPNNHAFVDCINGQAGNYTIIWDADEEAKERYKLISNSNYTELKLSSNQQYWRPAYKTVLTIDSHLSLQIKDQTIVVDNLIPRLQKLKAFS